MRPCPKSKQINTTINRISRIFSPHYSLPIPPLKMKQSYSWLLGRVAVTIYHFWRGMKETGSFCSDLLEVNSFKSGTLQYAETSLAPETQTPKHQTRPRTNLCGEERFVLSGDRRTDHFAQGPSNLSCPHQHPKN